MIELENKLLLLENKKLNFEIKPVANSILVEVRGTLGRVVKLLPNFSGVRHPFTNDLYYFRDRNLFKSFFVLLHKLSFGVLFGYVSELQILGSNFRVFKISPHMFGLELGLTHIVSFIVPKFIKFIISSKKLCFFSLDNDLLYFFISQVLFVKPVNLYLMTGISVRFAPLKLRKRKKKK